MMYEVWVVLGGKQVKTVTWTEVSNFGNSEHMYILLTHEIIQNGKNPIVVPVYAPTFPHFRIDDSVALTDMLFGQGADYIETWVPADS